MQKQQSNGIWDWVGIGLSAICIIHCVLTPIVLSLLPVLGQGISHHSFHEWIAPVLIIPALLALIPGVLKHRKIKPIIAAVIGLIAFIGATYLHDVGEVAELVVGLFGSTMLIVAHGLNHTYCKSCVKCEDSCGNI